MASRPAAGAGRDDLEDNEMVDRLSRRCGRAFPAALVLCLPLLVGFAPAPQQPSQPVDRRVAITFDDLPAVGTRLDLGTARAITKGLLDALVAADAPATGFVNENKLYVDAAAGASTGDPSPAPARVALLRDWLERGFALGNHGYSHRDLHVVPTDEFFDDAERGEHVLRPLMAEFGAAPRYFRHPYLHSGRTVPIKRSFEAFLAERGYRIAPVTIDNYDYLFARAYDVALDRNLPGLAERVVGAYLGYMENVVAYYELQSVAILGYELPHVLLLHANRLNGATLGELLVMLRGRGYAFVTLDEALQDPAYRREDTYEGPAGITWLHRWGLADGFGGDVFRGEPLVPAFVLELTR